MLELDDSVLLKEYVEHGSEEAFATLVARHVNKVYSIALRHTRNAHQAEEITQAVFVILARKSRQLGKRVILSGWLCRTARLSAVTFVRSEIRRTRREQEAHMQNLLNETESEVWPQIAPLLDVAMAGLSEADHDAIALRFFDGKSMKEIGAALGASEDAVKMRVNRAVEKLRSFFTRRGIVCSAAALTAAISANAVQAAPMGLAVSVSTAAALSGTAIATTATATATKAIAMITAQKTLIAGMAAVAVAAGVCIYVLQQLTAAPPVGIGGSLLSQSQPALGAASPRETLPIALANDSFQFIQSDKKFLVEFDPNTRRTSNSAPAIHIKCLVTPTSTGSADFLKSLDSFVGGGLAASRAGGYPVANSSTLSGQRIRVTGWMKTSGVGNWAGTSLGFIKANDERGSWDLMHDRPLHGTMDWQQIQFIVDVPKEPCLITLIPTLYGTGEMWADGFQIDIAPPNTPATDVGRWTVWSQCPTDFSVTLDPAVIRNGHPALSIAYVSSEPPEKYSFVWWGKHHYDLDTLRKYLGHTVRMSVWAKSEDVFPRAGLDFQPKDLNGKRLKTTRSTDRILGTTDWREYSIICDIPEETKDFQTAVFMYGDGKLWVDTNSFKWEIVGTLPAAKQLTPTSQHI